MALSALTAWQALVDQAQLQPREKVLVIGGSGGVGVYAVQLARVFGAEVAASGGESGRELVTRLGAGQYLDYKAGLVDQALSGFDVVLDAAGAGDGEALYRVLRPGGRMILLAGPPQADRASRHEVHATFFVVSPDGQELRHLASLVDKGELEPVVSQTFPLPDGRTAFEGGNRPHPPGKTVLIVP
jgi:NADPH:quinone reductase-like Zn-dependent oxidoreductase